MHGLRLNGRKVILLAQYGYSGGTRTYLRHLITFYSQLGIELLVVRDGPLPDPEMDQRIAECGYRSITFAEALGGPEPDYGIWDKIAGGVSLRRNAIESQAFRALLERESADLVVASVGHPGAHLGAVASCSRALYLLHTYPHGLRSRILRPVRFGMLRPHIQLVSVSRFAASTIEEVWRLPSGRVRVLYSTAGPVMPILGRGGGDPTIVITLGHVARHKDPGTWIAMTERVLSVYPSVRFVWAGEGPLIDWCRGEVAKRNLTQSVAFPGLVSNVDELMRSAAVYVQPSRVESLGLGVLDAARWGIPSVVSAVGGLSEVVTDGENGFLCRPGDADGFALGVGRLISDPEFAHQLGANALNEYRMRFSLEAWTSTLTELHEAALA